MNSFGRAVLAVGLSAVMTFTNPECFFQTGTEPVSVYAAEEKAAQDRTTQSRTTQSRTTQGRTAQERASANGSGESESTTEATTQKKEETTTEHKESQTSAEKNTGSSSSKNEGQSGSSTSDAGGDHTGSAEGTGSTGDTGTNGSAEGDSNHAGSTSTKTTPAGSVKNNAAQNSGTSAAGETEQTGSNEEATAQEQNKAKKNIASREEAEIQVKKGVKNIKDELAEETSPEGSDKTSTFIPKIYNDTRLAMKNNKEYIAGYVYFNQTDSAWNQNGYCIAKAGCGPTSMAVVITSLTGKWVTPLDTAIWGYQHGFYSRAGSAHEMIPAMAAAYGLKCQGAGTDYNAIKKALKAGKPVVCLMGPGYFTRGGHFMVLVAIDKNDCVTVADVGSRTRSAYKYRLSDVIAQSKGASAGGPFWIMSYDKESRAAFRKTQAIKDYTEEDFAADFADVSYMKVNGDLPEVLKEKKQDVSVKKVVSILTMSTGKGLLDAAGAGNAAALAGSGSTGTGILSPVRQNSQVITLSTKKEEQKQSQNLPLALKQDIARRQWEKRVDLSWMDSYLAGTLK